MLKKLLTLWSATLVVLLIAPLPVKALEIAITNNGGDSANEVVVNQTQATTVTQTNNTSVQNEVAVAAETGGNTVSDSSGETSIVTGDVTTQVEVDTVVNQSVVETPCCDPQGNTQIVVAGNGEGSTNTAFSNTATTTTVIINQQAWITNSITGTAITGRNTTTGNTGNVLIDTGNIHASVKLLTSANQGDVSVAQSQTGDVLIKIVGNGEGSSNNISYANNLTTQVFKDELADIVNRIGFELITGENEASDNMGDVTIKTGDVYLSVNLQNETNQNEIKIGCCDEETKPPKPPEPPVIPPEPPIKPPEPPKPPTNDGGGNGNGGSSSSGVGGAVLGTSDEILPATGTLDSLLMLLSSILFLLLGGYLRLRSGRSPSKSV